MRQPFKLESLQLAYSIVLQVENLQIVQPVERPILDRLDPTRVHVQHSHVLPPDEHVILQLAQHIPVEVDLGRVHRYPARYLLGRQAGTVDRVRVPRAVVVALAAGWAGHLAVAGVEVAAVAQGETVGLVSAEKLLGPGGGGGNDRDAARPRRPAHHVVQVHDARVLPGGRLIVDRRQPVHRAVAVEGIAADVELGQGTVLRHLGQQQRRQLHRLDHVRVHVHPGEIHLVPERVWPHHADVVVVDEEELDAVGHRKRRQLCDTVVTGVQRLHLRVPYLVVVTQALDIVAVYVQPLEVARYERVVEPLDVILREIQQQQAGDAGEHAVDVREEVAVEPDRLQPRVPLERVPLHVLHLVPREIQYLQVRQVPEHAARQVADIVADQPQPGQLIEVAERAVVKVADPILAEVQGLEEGEVAQRVRHRGQLVPAQIQLLQVGTVAKGERVDARDHVPRQRQPIQHEQAVEQLRADRVQPVLRQLERVQVVEWQERVALDPLDRVVPQVEDLQEEQILEHTRVDARQRVVREIEDDQSDQAEERGLVDAVAAQSIPGEIQHQQLLQPGEYTLGQVAEPVVRQVYLSQLPRAGEQPLRQRVQRVVAGVERTQRGQPLERVPGYFHDRVSLQVQLLQLTKSQQRAVLLQTRNLVPRQIQNSNVRPTRSFLLLSLHAFRPFSLSLCRRRRRSLRSIDPLDHLLVVFIDDHDDVIVIVVVIVVVVVDIAVVVVVVVVVLIILIVAIAIAIAIVVVVVVGRTTAVVASIQSNVVDVAQTILRQVQRLQIVERAEEIRGQRLHVALDNLQRVQLAEAVKRVRRQLEETAGTPHGVERLHRELLQLEQRLKRAARYSQHLAAVHVQLVQAGQPLPALSVEAALEVMDVAATYPQLEGAVEAGQREAGDRARIQHAEGAVRRSRVVATLGQPLARGAGRFREYRRCQAEESRVHQRDENILCCHLA